MNRLFLKLGLLLFAVAPLAAQKNADSTAYKKRVLETAEFQLLSSYYTQDGDFAAVSGGTGTEKLTDAHPTIIISVPLNADDVLTANVGISAYTSASSSNVNPFDGGGPANPFQASSGASGSDVWSNLTLSYSHSSADRNTIWSANISGSAEYDYTSFGAGGGYTRLMNQQNTELTIKANVFIDFWNTIYPSELRPFNGGSGLNDRFFQSHALIGNQDYNPGFTRFDQTGRNSYNLGLNFSQLLSRNMQGMLSLDLVHQTGLLSTPFQRVYFGDVENTFIEEFALADDVERLPGSRTKIALGGRLHTYLNERFVLRTFYRYYTDNWGITAHTANVEVPIKITPTLTLRPGYRYYVQTAADYFAPFDMHLSSSEFYTSDYDLSQYTANQYSMGISYTDILTKVKILNFGLKSADLSVSSYGRDNGFQAFQVAIGVKFVMD